MMINSARNTTTRISGSIQVSCSLVANAQRESFDALDFRALGTLDRLFPGVARRPRSPAELDFADCAGRDVLEREGRLPHEGVDLVALFAAQLEFLHQRFSEEH